jgi:hypothetical protein
MYQAVKAHRIVGPYYLLPYYLDNRLKDVGKVVNLTCRPRFTPQENYLINSRYSFLLEAESTPGP